MLLLIKSCLSEPNQAPLSYAKGAAHLTALILKERQSFSLETAVSTNRDPCNSCLMAEFVRGARVCRVEQLTGG